MNELVNKLCEIIKKENMIYTQILSISTKKTDTIIKGKIGELDAFVKEEQELIGLLSKIEINREVVFIQLCDSFGMDLENSTLTDLLTKLSVEEALSLEILQKKLLSILAELKTLNDNNGKLIQNSLEFIDFSINVLSSASTPGNNYNTGGYSEKAGNKRFFDMKL